MRDTTFGNSTNCSAVCGTERTVRGQRVGVDILGTSITCSGTRTSKAASNTTGWSIHLRHRNVESREPWHGTDELVHGAPQIPVLRPDLREPSGRAPPGSSYRLKSSGWGVGGSRIVAV